MRTRLALGILMSSLVILFSCKGCGSPEESVIVLTPEEMDETVSQNIRTLTGWAVDNGGQLDDSTLLYLDTLTNLFYQQNDYKSIWSSKEIKNPLADSLYNFVKNVRNYGLFPSDYHLKEIEALHTRLKEDSLAFMDAVVWTRLDVFSTDAFFRLLKDLKQSIMTPDSTSILYQSGARDSFFYKNLNAVFTSGNLTPVLESVEPNIIPYKNLKKLIPAFVSKMDTARYARIKFPDSNAVNLRKNVYARLLRAGFGDSVTVYPDSLTYARAVKKYQEKAGIEADGKVGKQTINSLNMSDEVKFRMIALTMDKYRARGKMPASYIWANIPSFRLDVWVNDELKLQSRIVVGKPTTPTPTLVSGINNMVTFPVWTIPASIIKDEILPQLRKDPGYLARKGYNLFTNDGEEIDPFSVDWTKYKTGIPWRIIQGSGDDNALGIFKFNFYNPYSVYLHDTNQRYLFANSNRALSHGCVRVQKWKDLAEIITTRDSTLSSGSRLAYNMDSVNTWLQTEARKTIYIKNKFPLYIDYFTCDENDGKIGFYEDIYNRDAGLIEKYFAKN